MKSDTWQCIAAAGLLLASGAAQAVLVPYTVNGVDPQRKAEIAFSNADG